MTLSYNSTIPDELLTDLRLYLGDLPEFNRLISGTELSDDQIKLAARLWLQKFNNTPPPISKKWKFEDENFPAWDLVFEGVMIQSLIMSGVVHSRNFLNFNDAGVSFTVSDKAQDYQSWIGMMMNAHAMSVQERRVTLNSEEGFDYQPSPDFVGGGYWR